MTEEVTTQKRRPGRPRKAEAVENQPIQQNPLAELEAMQNQIRYQMAQLIKLAESTGMNLQELYGTPPKQDTVVLESADEDVEPEQIVDSHAQKGPKPGQYLAGGNWIPWRKQDLNIADMVDFVPQPVPSIVFPMTDEEGRQKIRLDVNDLVCWLTVGIPNRVNRFFYNAYMDSYNSWRELERFKQHGPAFAPWGARGPDGRPAWHYEPFALTYGMDDDGRYLVRGGRHPLLNPLQQVREGNQEAI